MLKEYLVLSNVRLRSGRNGGVKEAYILGLKLVKEAKELENGKKIMVEVLEIVHIETGSLAEKF